MLRAHAAPPARAAAVRPAGPGCCGSSCSSPSRSSTSSWVSLQTGNADTGFTSTTGFANTGLDLGVHEPAAAVVRLRGRRDRPVPRHLVPARVLHRLQGGRWKNVLLLLIVLPFFTSYIVRTVAWQTILADDGWVLHRAQDVGLSAHTAGCWPRGRRSSRASPTTSCPSWRCRCTWRLEKIDRRLVEAATDLYASRATAFRKVTLPLALPGVFAGTLLTFIPAWATSSTPSSWAPRSST